VATTEGLVRESVEVGNLRRALEEQEEKTLLYKQFAAGQQQQLKLQCERELRELAEAHAGTQVACITRTKVQILTPAALQSSLGARMSC
jgi:hypothetical protein